MSALTLEVLSLPAAPAAPRRRPRAPRGPVARPQARTAPVVARPVVVSGGVRRRPAASCQVASGGVVWRLTDRGLALVMAASVGLGLTGAATVVAQFLAIPA